MVETGRNTPYFALVNRESEVLVGNMDKYAPYAWPMIESLMKSNQVFIQLHLFNPALSLLFYIGQPTSEKIISQLKSHEIK